MAPELFLALAAFSRDAEQDATLATRLSAAWIIITFVGVEFLWPLERAARLAANGGPCVEHWFEHGAVVDICAGQLHRKRNTTRVGYEKPFRSRLAAILWIWALGRVHFFAGIEI